MKAPTPDIIDTFSYITDGYSSENNKICADYEFKSYDEFYLKLRNEFYRIRSIIVKRCSAHVLQKLSTIRDDLTGLINVSITCNLVTVPPIHINTKILYIKCKEPESVITSINGNIHKLYISYIDAFKIDNSVIQCRPLELKIHISDVGSQHGSDLYIPNSVTHFRLYSRSSMKYLNEIKYPSSIKTLHLGAVTRSIIPFNMSILPKNLETLHISEGESIYLTGTLPKTITNLFYDVPIIKFISKNNEVDTPDFKINHLHAFINGRLLYNSTYGNYSYNHFPFKDYLAGKSNISVCKGKYTISDYLQYLDKLNDINNSKVPIITP